jgi:hypothetical protein
MDFENLFITVLSHTQDYLMRMRRYEEGGYEIVSFCDYSQFTVVIKYADNLVKHFEFMKRKLDEVKAKPVRCEVHFQKRRKSVPKELILHRWGDYATFDIRNGTK